jgi:hypothetical protein
LNFTLRIESKSVDELAGKLQQISRSSFPVAIRQTLNSAAFDVKKTTMPKESEKAFENRSKNFFKANSKVIQANGFNVNTMQSEVGFYENKLKNQSTNYAVKDLEQQENGGNGERRSFVALKQIRNSSGLVKANQRMESIREKPITRMSQTGRAANKTSSKRITLSKSQSFVKASMRAIKETDGLIMSKKNSDGEQIVSRVLSVSQSLGKKRKLKIKTLRMYTVKKNRKVNPKATHFMRNSAEKSAVLMEFNFQKHALNIIRKHGLGK